MYARIQVRKSRAACTIAMATLSIASTVWAPTVAWSQTPVELRGGIGVSTTGYDKEIANNFNLASRGWGFQGTFSPRFFTYVELLVEIGWEYWGQVCLTSECNPDRTQTSSVMASTGVGMASPILFVNDQSRSIGFALNADLGHEWVKGGLSTDNCLNCAIDDLDIDGGLWIEPGIDLYADPSVVIGFNYRIYESKADLTSRITIRVLYRSRR